MANIGDLAVTLSLDAVAFAQGLDKSDKGLKSFAASASATFAAISAGATAIDGVTGSIKASYDWFKQGLAEIVDTGRRARELGTELDTLAGIERMAGAHAMEMDSALLHMIRHLQEATSGGAEARAAFAQLDLDAFALAKLPLDKQLGAVADALNKLGDGADKTGLAMRIFGKDGAGTLQDLQSGAIGVAEAIAKIKAAGGLGFSERDVGNAIEAQKAIADMEFSFTRIKNVFVSEFAPLVKAAADEVSAIADKGVDLRGAFKDAALVLVEGMKLGVIESSNMLIVAHRIEKVYDKITQPGRVVQALERMAEPVARLAQMAFGFKLQPKDKFEEEIKAWTDHALGIADAARDKINGVSDGKGADKGGAGLFDPKGIQQKVIDLDLKLRDEIAAFGMAGDAVERFKLARQGATEEMLRGVDAHLAELKALKDITSEMGAGLNAYQQYESQAKKLDGLWETGKVGADAYLASLAKLKDTLHDKIAADVERIHESTATAFDKIKAEVEKLDKYLADGKIGGQEYAAELAKDWQGVVGVMAKVEHPGAMLEGSMDAYHTIRMDEDRDRPGDVQDRIRSLLEQLLQTEKRKEEYEKATADAVSRIFKKG